MPARRPVLQIFIALFFLAALAAPAQEYSFRTFGATDGLTNLSVQKLFQDHHGFLWISTENGVFRSDGQHIQAITADDGLPATESVSFGETRDGTLLIGGASGLFRATGDRFTQLPGPFKKLSRNQGISTDNHGRTLLATNTGLYVLTLTPSGPTYARLYPAANATPETVTNIFPEGDALWFGCRNQLCHLDAAGQLTTFGPDAGYPATPVVTVLRDSAGSLWIRARSQGVFELPAGATHLRRPDTPVPGEALTGTPSLDRAGHILLGTPDGLILQTAHGWQLLDRRSGLRGGVYATLEDGQHNLWLGMGGRGLVQWRGYREWEGYSTASGLAADNVYEILPQPDGSVYAATEAGLSLGKPTGDNLTWTTVPGTAGIPFHSLKFLPSGDILFGTSARGIGLFHPANNHLAWYGEGEGLAPKRAFALCLAHDGTLYAATDLGLYTAAAPYTHYTRIAEIPPNWFWTVTESPDGTVLAGGADGLFALRNNYWQHLNKASGLHDDYISAIGPAPDGSILVGYQYGGGIDRIQLTPTLHIDHNIGRPSSDGLIYFLNFDHSGNLWAATEHGLDRLDAHTHHWQHLDTTDGLLWDDLDIGGFSSTPDGTLYFGTSGGLSILRPRADKPIAEPTVLFTGLHLADTDIQDLRAPTFAFNSGTLTARFAAPDALQDSSLLFRYRLSPNLPWTTTNQPTLELAALAPGSYTLEVEALDNTGQWSPHAATYSFRIQPPFYRRWWFLTLLFLLPFVVLALYFRVHKLAATAREARLRRVVDARTAELRAANEELTRLTMQDSLTGLSNRRRFDQALSHECDRVNRSGAIVSLILIDVDHFKALNDSLGHPTGDQYLIAIAAQLSDIARRKIEVAARIGGEEFALLLPGTDATNAARIAELVRTRIEALCLPHPASPAGACITVSLGVATATRDQICTTEAVVATADKALYRAKTNGRNRIEIA